MENEGQYKCKKIICKSALNKINSSMLPYKWDLNIYRGCEHKCRYCFAVYSHQYIEDKNFFDHVYVKTNVVDRLEQELRARRWNREVINIGGVTDSYQPCEESYKLMPDILKLLIKYKTPAIISTKSDLILRDISLIDELSKVSAVNIACTITTMNEDIARKIEPGAVCSKRRVEVLREMKKTGASVGLHNMPIIPYLTDSYENLNSLYAMANDVKVDYVIPSLLNLRGETKKVFLNFIYHTYPDLYHNICMLYQDGRLNKEYKLMANKRINELIKKYGIPRNYMKAMNMKLKQYDSYGEQLSLFKNK
ncbi:MAG: radical SAM protein [Clostridia bacterium]|nr:radical SAM protein [Clostridia bacterium]